MKNVYLYINGQVMKSVEGKTFSTYNPSTGEMVAQVEKSSRKDAQLAIESANRAKEKFAQLTVWDRSKLLRRIADKVERRKEEIASAITLEQGKPYYQESLREVELAVEGFANASEQIKWFETSVITVKDPTKRVWTIRQPKGVYGVITPWNVPVNIPVEYIAPGLATGNTIVWLPAPSVSYCTSKLMDCIIEADIPKGVVNYLTGPGEEAGDEIVINPMVDAIGFTGSTQVGNIIAKQGFKKTMVLELGGNGPTVIFEDAKITKKEIKAIGSACFMNAGQVCAATGRILVHESRVFEITKGLVEYAKDIIIGDPFSQETTMGPLHNETICKKMDSHIQDAVEKGAKVEFGGKRREGFNTNLFYEPTILSNVHGDALVNCEETFGPIAPIVTFSTDNELKELINKSSAGLTSAVFTSDISRAIKFAENIKTGIVNINDKSSYWELHLPFGGVSGRESGKGKLGGKKMLEEMTDLKVITMTI